MIFHKGQRVICIRRDAWHDYWGFHTWEGPRYKEICTVVDINVWTDLEIIGLKLAEYGRFYYQADQFRPLSDIKEQKGMEVLRKLLHTTKIPMPIPTREETHD